MRTLGTRIHEWRKFRGLSQAQLADGICSASAVSQLESDKISPTINLLNALCSKLGVTADDILHGGEVEQRLEEAKTLIKYEKFEDALYMLKTIEHYPPETDLEELRRTANFYIGYILLKLDYREEAKQYLEIAYRLLDKENPAYKSQARQTLLLLCRAFSDRRRLKRFQPGREGLHGYARKANEAIGIRKTVHKVKG